MIQSLELLVGIVIDHHAPLLLTVLDADTGPQRGLETLL